MQKTTKSSVIKEIRAKTDMTPYLGELRGDLIREGGRRLRGSRDLPHKGVKHIREALTLDDARAIRAEAGETRETMTTLAWQWGISRQYLYKILKGEALPDPPRTGKPRVALLTGEQIKALRLRLRFSRAGLARQIGTGLRALTAWENGEWLPAPGKVAALMELAVMNGLDPRTLEDLPKTRPREKIVVSRSEGSTSRYFSGSALL